MKVYEKPELSKQVFSALQALTSLNTWLTTNGLEGAGITTYEVLS